MSVAYWFDSVPDRWSITPIKHSATVTLGKMLQSAPSDEAPAQAPYMRAANVQPDGVLALDDVQSMWFKKRELDALDLRAGDVVVVEGGIGGYGRAAFLDRDLPGWGFQNSINRVRVTGDVDARFIAYCLLAARRSGYITAYCNVVSMPHLTAEKLAAMRLPWPPLDEQRQIADYLDHETAKVDALIAKQEQLIDLVTERRAALIARVVTRGLRETSMQETAVPWIGSIPEDWTFGNIRRFALMRTGHTPSRATSQYWVDCDIPWFTLADVWQIRDGRRKYLGDTKSKISKLGLENSAAELLPAGTVILSRTASVGFSGIMPVPMATSQDFWNWVCGPRLSPDFLLWVFRGMRQEFRRLMAGSTHQTIYQPVAASIQIPLPPLDEQRRIADYLDEQTSKIDALIEKTQQFIEVSKERRAALITAAVMGQIDVRSKLAADDVLAEEGVA